MAQRQVVMDDDAVMELQKLKNGFVRQVLTKLAAMVSAKTPDAEGKVRLSLSDVQQAMRELADDPQALAGIESPATPTAPAGSG